MKLRFHHVIACAAGLNFLISGCVKLSTQQGPPLPPLPSPLVTRHASLATVPAPPPPKPLTWHWECFETPLDGTWQTGIESSTNLGAWQLEAQWPVTTVSNSWTEPDQSPPVKFYRAFIK